MRKSLVILVVLAVAMAGGTVYVVSNVLKSDRNKPQVVKRQKPAKKLTYVLVAQNTMQPGAYIRPGNVRWQVWPTGRVSPSYITRVGTPTARQRRRVKELEGAVVRLQVPSGQPITDQMYVLPGERGFLAAVLKPGMRAVSIKINASSGVAGLAQPGDRVDLIWIYSIRSRKGGRRDTTRVAETLLVGVRLLAVNENLGQPHRVSSSKKVKKAKGASRARPKKIKLSTATVELTPKQAEMIAVALTKGTITLSLNSLARPTTKKSHLITAANTDQTLKADSGDGNPKRGRTFTMDQHVSRLISFVNQQQPKEQKVVILRGGKAEDAGSVRKKNKVDKDPDADDGDDEGEE
jgi:pilus assembly protein CpaB